ncbi:MAG: AAA domain-containing protein [Bacteroidetes bacterium]|nr:AAA domain-containing protein [Bacteroidota bacterium]MDA1121470.1 AAA domain-containing protein [Bacteroidota bacterium]
MTSKEQLVFLRKLLKIEKDEDFQQYQLKVLNTSIQGRVKDGVCWYPVRVQSHHIGTGERMVLQIEKSPDDDSRHVFQVGSVISLFNNNHSKERANDIGAVVSYLRKNVMKIVLNSDAPPDWLHDGKLGIDLMFDEATYREMDKALEKVTDADKGRVSELRNLFYGEKKVSIRSGHLYQSIKLNAKQNEALTNIFNANDIAIVHGPPGTGKTTTIVHAIKEVVKDERQVLVCAPSNAAVDLLVEKLSDEGLEVLRLGHPARISGAAVKQSLDHQISYHDSYKLLKEVRKKSEEMKKIGLKYKRHFGPSERKQRKYILDEARNLKFEADHIEHYITKDLLNKAEVVAATLINANHQLIRARTFKSVFIDEASQALEAASWIPIMKAERVILAGDHHQLPPTIKSIEAAKQGLEVTLFEKAIKNQEAAVMLQTQYRMHPDIMQFASEMFYEGKLEAAPSVRVRNPVDLPVFEFIDTSGTGFNEEVHEESLSTYNLEEARLVHSHLQQLLKGIGEQVIEDRMSIGVIAPYKAQINLLNEIIMDDEFFIPFKGNLSINTVDVFQGQERDIIYISLVRSNDKGEIGFLKESRRLNVAMTRAKTKLVMFGDSATLCQHQFFDKLVDYTQAIGGYKSAFELTPNPD